MAYNQCIICYVYITNGTRCNTHKSTTHRGYGHAHREMRRVLIYNNPKCAMCGHTADRQSGRCDDAQCPRCPLQLDHVVPIRGGRLKGTPERQVLCAVCNRAKG